MPLGHLAPSYLQQTDGWFPSEFASRTLRLVLAEIVQDLLKQRAIFVVRLRPLRFLDIYFVSSWV